MKFKFKGIAFKKYIIPLALSVLSSQATALPQVPVKAHPPIHYKPNTLGSFPTGLAPRQVRVAYGFTQVRNLGKGQVIGIVNAYDHPRIQNDLAVFTSHYGILPCNSSNGCFRKIYANGVRPRTDAEWAGETALDVEWAHAVAPSAKILLVEAADNSLNSLFNAIQVAINNGATVISMSWGANEFPQETSFDRIFINSRVSFVAASGDNGNGTSYPAASPYVLAVGGTTLFTDLYGNYQGEETWSGSGGGLSIYEVEPTRQKNLPIPLANNRRGIPDVAYNANPDTGFSVYNSIPSPHGVGWFVVGGTSAGAPQWAGIIAIANSYFGKNHGLSILRKLYGAANPSTGKYIYNYHDITFGTNGNCGYYCTARPGYDYVTGLGSPNLFYLIPDLANYPIKKV